MPRIVRRQPLIERIKAYLNPFDFLLWLSEELESNGWDQLEKEWALPIGLGLNLLVFIARANMNVASRTYDDVFGEVRGGSGGLVWLVSDILFVAITHRDRLLIVSLLYRLRSLSTFSHFSPLSTLCIHSGARDTTDSLKPRLTLFPLHPLLTE